jgi:uroporphyrinogen decarboxylase
MTGKERMLIAMCGGKPDRVPVCPDISNMIPCRLTGKTFEQIYLHNNPPLGEAYYEAVKYFGFDGWYQYWEPKVTWKSRHGMDAKISKEIHPLPEGRFEQIAWCKTQAGTFREAFTYYPADPPTQSERYIKNVEKDLPTLLKWLDADIVDIDWSGGAEDYARLGDLGIWGLAVNVPGPQAWLWSIDGGMEAVVAAIYDYPDLIDQWYQVEHRRIIDMTKRILNAPIKIDFILLGASGLLTLSNPDIFLKYSLPTVKEVTRLCKQANMPTMLHACGKSKFLVESFVKETDLNCFNPLEKPPMGDIELSEAKKIAGGKMALMGNLLTTDTMLRGTVQDVVRESKKAIDDAGAGGGFILSTGDQCGRDTPDENIRAMIQVAQTYGKY